MRGESHLHDSCVHTPEGYWTDDFCTPGAILDSSCLHLSACTNIREFHIFISLKFCLSKTLKKIKSILRFSCSYCSSMLAHSTLVYIWLLMLVPSSSTRVRRKTVSINSCMYFHLVWNEWWCPNLFYLSVQTVFRKSSLSCVCWAGRLSARLPVWTLESVTALLPGHPPETALAFLAASSIVNSTEATWTRDWQELALETFPQTSSSPFDLNCQRFK